MDINKPVVNEEVAYREYFLKPDITLTIICIASWVFCICIFSLSDYVQYGLTNKFYKMILLRLIFAVFSLAVIYALNKTTSVKTYDLMVLTWSLLVGGFVLFINSIRPPGYYLYAICDILLLFCYYFLLANNFYFRVIPAWLFTIGNVFILLIYKMPPELMVLNTLLITYAATNLAGFTISRRMYSYRLTQYKALADAEYSRRKLQKLASTDALTGIFNRRMIFRLGQEQLNRYKRYNNIFSVMMIDIDRFKDINDNYGHQTGDLVLKMFTDYIKQNTRQNDISGRIGGDEFILILPETDQEDSVSFGDRFIEGLADLKLNNKDGPITVSVSIGITTITSDDLSFDDLVKRVDEALYKAKHRGRNCIELM